MPLDVERFLRNGTLLGLELNKPISLVEKKFGEPDHVPDSSDLVLLKYDGLEFTAQNNEIVIINLEFMDGALATPKSYVVPDQWQNKDIHSWIEKMEQAEIGWHICPKSSYDENLVLVTEANVLIYYNLIYKEVGKVQVASFNKKLYRYE